MVVLRSSCCQARDVSNQVMRSRFKPSFISRTSTKKVTVDPTLQAIGENSYRLKREGLNHPGPLLVESPIAMSSVKSSLTSRV